jgi:hypothetical protein
MECVLTLGAVELGLAIFHPIPYSIEFDTISGEANRPKSNIGGRSLFTLPISCAFARRRSGDRRANVLPALDNPRLTAYRNHIILVANTAVT